MASREDEIKKLIGDPQLDKIVESAVKSSLTKNAPPSLKEGYIAQQKVYGQVTEFASGENKSFHQDLYSSYVKTLNNISAQIDAHPKDDVNSRSSTYRMLKQDETYNLNAVWLHELYFANCFDPQSELFMDSPSFMKIQKQWGNFDNWQADFIACAQASGQGFVVFGMNVYLRQYVNTFIDGYSENVMLGLFPLLVIDCHEHAYFDSFYGDKSNFIIACMQEINWNVVDGRVSKCEKVLEAMK